MSQHDTGKAVRKTVDPSDPSAGIRGEDFFLLCCLSCSLLSKWLGGSAACD